MAPQARPVAAVPPAGPRRADHRRLRAAGARRRAAPARAAAVDLPGHPGRDGRRDLPVRRRHQLLPARPPPDGLRDVVVGAPLHLPRAVPVLLAPDRHGRLVRRPSRRALLVDGAVARDARRRGRRPHRPAGLALAAPPGPRGRRHAGRAGRRLDPAARAAASTGCRSRGGQFFQWRFLRRGLWWQAHPYSLSAAPAGDLLRITVKDLGDHSAGLARLRPGTRVAIEGPYGVFTADTDAQDRLLLIGAGVGTAPILALLQELPAGADVVVVLRASDAGRLRPARRGRRRGATGAAGAWSSSSAAASGCGSTPAPCARSPPTCTAARSTCAGPTRSRGGSPASSAAPACPPTAIHFESFTF